MHKRIKARRSETSSASFALNYRHIGDLAVRALLYEVSATPKPGLVDRANNGAHRDMCFETFLDSAASLRSCFEECARAGAAGASRGGTVIDSFLVGELRSIGIAGEKAMFAATKGVNTHKGLIFSLGIISAACGMIAGGAEQGVSVDWEHLQSLCADFASKLLAVPLEEETHGQEVYKKTGITGIRGEALSGFDSAFSIGLPALKRARADGMEINSAMVYTLLCLMAETEDSNVVYRGGLEGLEFVRKRAAELLGKEDRRACGALDFDAVRELDRECIERNLSPGGCADLLAISVMLYFILEKNDHITRKEKREIND